MHQSSLMWEPVTLAEVEAARERTRGIVSRTPLVPLDASDLLPVGVEIWLKLENLQPVRSFKLRGVWNQIASWSPEDRAQGVWTVSSGNTAQAVAWSAQRFGIVCTVAIPETTPQAKIDNILRYGGQVIKMPMDQLLSLLEFRRLPGTPGTMIHPFSNPAMMAGNGVIALEIVEDLTDFEVVVAPWGGGGLVCGIASTMKSLQPNARTVACQGETGNPLTASLTACAPVEVHYDPSTLADGIAANRVYPEMFALAQQLVGASVNVSESEIAAAIKLLAERTRIIAEGAGAASVAAAIAGKAGKGKIVCIVSGGNIDSAKFANLLNA